MKRDRVLTDRAHAALVFDTDGLAQGRFLFSGTAELFEQHGFERVRQVGKHAWIVTRTIEAA